MITRSSLDATYFDGIFASDDDPWDLASSPYEAAKFAQTKAAIADRRYAQALEVGCAHGVLTGDIAGLCDRLIAVDISRQALAKARVRVGDLPPVTLREMAFPKETPVETGFDLVLLSEVVYYWSVADIDRAADWLAASVTTGGRVLLVHYTGETDYPQRGDDAVAMLREGLGDHFEQEKADRHDRYRLDLWRRR